MIIKILYIIWIVLGSLIVLLGSLGAIHFGWGLGDIVYHIIIVLFMLMSILIFIFFGKNVRIVLTIDCYIFLIFIILKFTIYRGGISPWDGKIFFW